MTTALTLAEQILAETEYVMPTADAGKAVPTGTTTVTLCPERIGIATYRVIQAFRQGVDYNFRAAIAFSGGSDSLVLLDIVNTALLNPDMPPIANPPYVIWIDTQMEYPGTQEFIHAVVKGYGFDLRIARAQHTPQEQWRRTGFPMLGKVSARNWMQKNRGQGFAINVSDCCRAMKIVPARRLTKNLGCTLQITGQRGQQDDHIRGLRTIKDGTLFYQERDRIWICNPLTGWTDEDIRGYIQQYNLQEHPARALGAQTIGCIYCGGGSQYTNSGFRVLRFSNPPLFQKLIIEYNTGPIILALKYKVSLYLIQQAIQDTGGLSYLLQSRPWVFDFTRKTPIKGYNK